MLLTALIFLLILSLVLIHELGHFLVAKKLGIKVEEFGFGFPPKIFGIKKGETLYSINLLPIGGFVKLYGEDPAGGGSVDLRGRNITVKDEKRAFYARSVGQRAMVVVAGVIMNALLATIIFYAYLGIAQFKAEIPLLDDHKFLFVHQTVSSDVIITAVSKNSPAEKAGITPFSRIISVNGQRTTRVEEFISVVNKNKGKEIVLVWRNEKTGEQKTARVIPRLNPPKNQGALGIAFFPLSIAKLEYATPAQKIFSGVIHPTNLLIYNFKIIGKLIGVSVKEKSAAPLGEGVSGPVGIYSLVGNIVKLPDVKEKMLQTLNLAGLLSISLAFFNILPIPALDGGRFFFIAIEAITGKKINQRFEALTHTIGMAILLTLIALITFKDLGRLFK